MGRPMAGNLIQAGHRLRVWNRSPRAAEELARKGAEMVAEPREAFGEVLISMLADDTAVREVVLDIARALGVPVRSQDATARARARAARLKTPDHFFGESGPDAYWSVDRTIRHLRELPAGVSEFMCHPGRFDVDLAYSRYGRQREVELIGLGTPSARAAAAALGITVCTFADL